MMRRRRHCRSRFLRRREPVILDPLFLLRLLLFDDDFLKLEDGGHGAPPPGHFNHLAGRNGEGIIGHSIWWRDGGWIQDQVLRMDPVGGDVPHALKEGFTSETARYAFSYQSIGHGLRHLTQILKKKKKKMTGMMD